MSQPENESARATAGDLEWLERVVASGRTGTISNFPVSVARRILTSLRTPAVPVADRERLARALYIANGTERAETNRASFWLTDAAGATREYWLGEADRLVRVLGGFPAAPTGKDATDG